MGLLLEMVVDAAKPSSMTDCDHAVVPWYVCESVAKIQADNGKPLGEEPDCCNTSIRI